MTGDCCRPRCDVTRNPLSTLEDSNPSGYDRVAHEHVSVLDPWDLEK